MIKNLEDDVDDEQLRKEFSKLGEITNTKVVTKVMTNGRSNRIGFVCFSSPYEAIRVFRVMQRMHDGSPNSPEPDADATAEARTSCIRGSPNLEWPAATAQPEPTAHWSPAEERPTSVHSIGQ